MVSLLGVIATAIVMGFIDIPRIWKRRVVKDLVAYSVMLLAGTVLAILIVRHVQLPNLIDILKIVYGPFYNGLMYFIG